MEHAVENLKTMEDRRSRRRGSTSETTTAVHPALLLQQRAGNQAMQQLLRGKAIQAKLAVSQPGDPEEQEADAMAGRIMRSHAGAEATGSSCSCGDDEEETCDECRQKAPVSRKVTGGGGSAAAGSHKGVGAILRTPGQRLDGPTRAFFEPRFGRDFSGVRVHTDVAAAASARAIRAHAYAAGEHLVFDTGEFAPETETGRRLLAHELTHVAQQDGGCTTLYRDLDPKLNRSMTPAYAQGLSDSELDRQESELTARLRDLDSEAEEDFLDNPNGGGKGDPEWDAVAENLKVLRDEKDRRSRRGSIRMQVQVLSPEQYAAMTGLPAEKLPEGKYVSAAESAVPGAGMGLAAPPRPGLPIPNNSTGILWEGHHLSDLAVANGELTARGFRAPFPVHVASAIERKLVRGGGQFTQMLNTGGQDLGGEPLGLMGRFTNLMTGGRLGQYRNDWYFPYMPGAKAVYRTDLPPGEAADFADYMGEQVGPLGEQDYRFSTPSPDNPAYARAYGNNPCPPGASNCITVPSELNDRALGGRNLVLDKDGNLVDIMTGEPGSAPGLASNMDEYVNQPEEFFTNRGLTVTPTAGPMWLRAGAGFIKAGGVVLMVFGAVQSYERIEEASPEERPIVEAEEAGSWGGGFIGNVVGSALGGATVCAETGPGAFFCALAFGIAGGITGGVIGKSAMHSLAESLRMTPVEFINTSTLMFGTPEDKRALCQMREINNPNDDGYDPMCGNLGAP